MYDILLNAVKLALSEDARKSVTAITDFIQRSPEWEKDICTLDAKVEATHPEHASLIAGLAAGKMKNLQYPDESIRSFRTAFSELGNNAFQHGCDGKQDIHIKIEVSSEYVSATLTNAKGHEFNLRQVLEENRQSLRSNARKSRGRGLLMVDLLADSLEQFGKTSVKAVFYRDRVSLERLLFKDLVIYRVNSGILNPSLSRRIVLAALEDIQEHDVILDLGNLAASSPGSDIVTVTLKLSDLAIAKGHKFVAVVARKIGSEISLCYTDASLMVDSWQEALDRVGKLASAQEVFDVIRIQPRRVLIDGEYWIPSRN